MVQRLLGEGGQGRVYFGTEGAGGREVAIKELLTDSEELLHRFRNEAEIDLDCPQVVRPLAFGEDGGHWYLVMEYAEGVGLDTLLEERGRLPMEEVLPILRQAAIGLGVAHRQCIVHRDIKPENLLIAPDGGVKLTDFGIACFLTRERRTMLGATLGTAHYMSPEQVQDAAAVDCRSDIFSLGVVTYEALTGSKPFDSDLTGELFLKILHEEPTPLRRLAAGLTDGVEALVSRMLEKDPKDRYPSMEAVLADLDALEQGGAPGAGPSAVPGAAGPPLRGGASRPAVSCKVCGHQGPPGSVFCEDCGTDLRIVCSHCGGLARPASRFCPACGEAMKEDRPASGVLVGVKGAFMGERIELRSASVTVGRHPSNVLTFVDTDDIHVSRFHARLYLEGNDVFLEGWDWVRDDYTTNGTFVNGRNIDGEGRVRLRHGDRLRFGDTFFRFEG